MAGQMCEQCHTLLGENGCLHEYSRGHVFIDVKREKELAQAERDEFETFCQMHNCVVRGCIYGHELNNYCICCGAKRPEANMGWS